MHETSLRQNLYLILNAVEAISIYNYTKSKIIKSSYYYNYLNNLKHNIIYYNEKSIELINELYKIIVQKSLQEIVTDILENYSEPDKNKITLQYLKRYKYIYKKNQDYYAIHSNQHRLNIEKIAIVQVYIIYQINQYADPYLFIDCLLGKKITPI